MIREEDGSGRGGRITTIAEERTVLRDEGGVRLRAPPW